MNSRFAWVVFTNQTDLPWLRILKIGYRHCFIIIRDGEHWVSIDPMANYMDVGLHQVIDGVDLPYWLESQGHQVIQAGLNSNIDKAAPWMFFTCVEACKRVLGIHNRFVFTPYQLYRYLKINNQFNNLKGD